MKKIINIASFSRSRLNQDAVKGSYYGWHSQFARKLVGKVDANIESWSIDAALPHEQRYEKDGVTYRLFPSGFFLSPGREISGTLLKALKLEAHEHDIVVHLHDYHNWQSYAIALTVKAPVVAHFHGATHRPIENLRNPRRWLATPLFLVEQLFENVAMKRVRHFFLANTRDKRVYERRRSPFSFCPMAPELDVFTPTERTAARIALGIDVNTKVLLNVGGFAPVKNLELLVRAFVELRMSVDARLFMLGPTYSRVYQARIMAMIRRVGVEDSVQVVGMISRERLNAYYNAADALLVSSSPGEGGPTVVLEALAVGLPVVSTPVGFTRDILPKAGGLLTLADAPSDLVPALRTVLGSVMKDRVPCRPWTWDDVIRTILLVYSRLFGTDRKDA